MANQKVYRIICPNSRKKHFRVGKRNGRANQFRGREIAPVCYFCNENHREKYKSRNHWKKWLLMKKSESAFP